MAEKLGLYVHIPFCRSKCDYCDFYSLAGKEGRMDDYQKALLAHMKETAPLTRGWQVDTVYFGGGTPSFYGEKRLREVLKTVAKRFDLAKDAEITVECNPDSVDKKVFQALRRAGVNRISLGVQSAHDCELNCLHRPHTFQQAQRAVAAAREAKIKNISLDLIYGLPNQDMAGWRDTVEQVLELESLHLVLLLLRNGIFSHETMSPKEGYSADIERALKYIALNYQQPLTLEEVAGYCNLSPTYFSRKFRLITGQTFKEHVNYIRLRQATQMLLMTDNSITKIAMLCGFGSSNYFKDLFRASTGRSPREYRKHSGLPIHPHLRDNG